MKIETTAGNAEGPLDAIKVVGDEVKLLTVTENREAAFVTLTQDEAKGLAEAVDDWVSSRRAFFSRENLYLIVIIGAVVIFSNTVMEPLIEEHVPRLLDAIAEA